MTEGPSADSRARPAEIIFKVTEAVEGWYDAKALGQQPHDRDADGGRRSASVTVPRNRDVRIGTLDVIIADVAAFLGLPKQASTGHPLRLM